MEEALSLRGLLSPTKPGNASRKKDFRFPTKEQTGFQIEKAEQSCGPGAERSRAAAPWPRSVRNYKKNIATYFRILAAGADDEPERYMLNMRCPPQSCLIVFSCSERVGFHFVGGGGKDFY